MFNLFKKKNEEPEMYISPEGWNCKRQMENYLHMQYTNFMRDLLKKTNGNKEIDDELFQNSIWGESSYGELRNGFAIYLFLEIVKRLDRLENLIKGNGKSSKSNKKSGNGNKLVKKK